MLLLIGIWITGPFPNALLPGGVDFNELLLLFVNISGLHANGLFKFGTQASVRNCAGP